MFVADDVAQPGEEGVALPQLADAAALPLVERHIRATLRRGVVTFQQQQPARAAAQPQRSAQPRNPRADHNNLFLQPAGHAVADHSSLRP